MTLSPMPKEHVFPVQQFPLELQVRLLSYLRAVDLSAVHQVNCYFWQGAHLQHAIVVYCAEQVYPVKWTEGFELQPISKATAPRKNIKATQKSRSSSVGSFGENDVKLPGRPKDRSSSCGSFEEAAERHNPLPLYTFEHLRNMELLVVARVLNSPEPTTGFVVSKSWCKTALVWLEGQQERMRLQDQADEAPSNNSSGKKKKKKVKKSKKERKSKGVMAVVAPPPPNINSDITCEHDQLQHYTSSRSARARRRILDKQAWKILKALYPESTPLPAATSECLQCHAEACQAKKRHEDKQEDAKQKRKLPLKDPAVRRFYTRARGVPEQCLRGKQHKAVEDGAASIVQSEKYDKDMDDRKMPAKKLELPAVTESEDSFLLSRFASDCPLVDGIYFVLPRSWCHGWRRFIKTGEGGTSSCTYSPPDAACLLCDAHRMALLPPHLEAFLYGESSQLLEGAKQHQDASFQEFASSPSAPLPPGLGPTDDSVLEMRALGLSEGEINRQLSAMRAIEARRQRAQARQAALAAEESVSRNELLDRENHSVVEILSQDEFRALEACWPGTTLFALRFTVNSSETDSSSIVAKAGDSLVCCGVNVCTPVCRSCDTSGRQCTVSIKNRARGWVKKNSDQIRAPASLEY